MSKNPISPTELAKIIQATQSIEGYKEADAQIVLRVKELRAKHGIKVSPRK